MTRLLWFLGFLSLSPQKCCFWNKNSSAKKWHVNSWFEATSIRIIYGSLRDVEYSFYWLELVALCGQSLGSCLHKLWRQISRKAPGAKFDSTTLRDVCFFFSKYGKSLTSTVTWCWFNLFPRSKEVSVQTPFQGWQISFARQNASIGKCQRDSRVHWSIVYCGCSLHMIYIICLIYLWNAESRHTWHVQLLFTYFVSICQFHRFSENLFSFTAELSARTACQWRHFSPLFVTFPKCSTSHPRSWAWANPAACASPNTLVRFGLESQLWFTTVIVVYTNCFVLEYLKMMFASPWRALRCSSSGVPRQSLGVPSFLWDPCDGKKCESDRQARSLPTDLMSEDDLKMTWSLKTLWFSHWSGHGHTAFCASHFPTFSTFTWCRPVDGGTAEAFQRSWTWN